MVCNPSYCRIRMMFIFLFVDFITFNIAVKCFSYFLSFVNVRSSLNEFSLYYYYLKWQNNHHKSQSNEKMCIFMETIKQL